MNKFVYKLTTAVSTAALLTGSVASVAFGTTTVTVSGNGADSDNTANVTVSTSNSIVQNNNANIQNNVNIDANTGDNDANDNTGGDVSIDTGDANVSSSVSNSANSNVASVACGGCPGDTTVKISGNGADSDNTADVKVANQTAIQQTNNADISNNVDVDAETGDNEAEDNTGGDVSIDTGDADVEVGIDNKANFNGVNLDECCELGADIKIAGNGADSDNDVKVKLSSELGAQQSNNFSCEGKGGEWGWLNFWGGSKGDCTGVDVDADTGGNDAEDNTSHDGGDPSVETGDADVKVESSTEANSNVLGDLGGF